MTTGLRQGNTIDAIELKGELAGTRFAASIHHDREVASTNDLALEAAQAGERWGVWVADAQTAGRGRGGHSWHSAPGDGLYVSALLAPALPAVSSASLSLSLVAGLAAWAAIREVCGLLTDIRWPNDLVTRPFGETAEPSRKLGGVLVEAAVGAPPPAARPTLLRYAVIGIGINVAHRSFAPELATTATSLFLEGWQTPDRQPLLVALLRNLDRFTLAQERAFAGLPTEGEPVPTLSEASTWVQGKWVEVPEQGGYTGVTAGLDPSGFLQVQSDDGVLRTVRSGGVRELLRNKLL